MITRISLRPHVCLRCQRNLTRRFTQTHASTESQLTSPNGDISVPSTTSLQDEPLNQRSTFRIKRRPSGSRKPKIGQGTRTIELDKNVSKLHGHRGRKLQEELEDLNLKSLGDAAKAVVLRDSKYTFYTHTARLKDQEPEHVDIAKVLEKERGLVSPEEVRHSIDELRPRNDLLPQTWEKLNEFVGTLSEGFTAAQLAGYIKFWEATSATIEGGVGQDADDIAPRTKMMKATPWMPGVSRELDTFDTNPLRGYIVASHTTKQKLTMTIFRQCWQLEVSDISEGIGQFEIKLDEADIDLLANSSDSPLISLQNDYLAHEDEGVQIIPGRGILRVTTLKHKRSIILLLLAQSLESIQREVISLKELYEKTASCSDTFELWRDRFYNNAVLQEIGQITKTDVRLLSNEVIIASTFTDSERKSPSSRIDTVKRLLAATADSADQTQYFRKSNDNRQGKYLNYPHTEGLTWWEKLRDWSRWTADVSKQVKDKPIVHHLGRQQPSQSKEPLGNVPQPKASPTPSWWGEFHESSALFGTILHSSIDEGHPLTKPSRSSKGALYSFSSLIPNLSRTLQKTVFNKQTDESSTSITPSKNITLRFLPDPYQPPWDEHKPTEQECGGYTYSKGVGSKALRQLPHIEMRFSVLEDNSVKLKDVLAITSSAKSDMMLPSNGIDLRFQDRTTRRLKYSKSLDNLRDFISKSIFDLRRGMLVTPPSLLLPIDRAILSDSAQKVVNFQDDNHNVRYMFAGLDIRSTISVTWKGWRLLYTSVEAGQAGGRRSELKLRPIKDGMVGSTEEFVAAAYQLAYEIGDNPALLEVSLDSVEKKPLGKSANYHLWVQRPNVFDDKQGSTTWFINQTQDDEDWDED